MKCCLQKCDAACGECADRVPRAMFIVFIIKNLNYIAEDIGSLLLSVGHSFFEKGCSDHELRTVISEKIDDLVSSGACKFGTKELLIANYDIFYLEMSRWNTQPSNLDGGNNNLKHRIWHTTYRIDTDILRMEERIKWHINAIECSNNVINAIEALLKAYRPDKSWDEIITDPSNSEYIGICQNLHYSMGLYHDEITNFLLTELQIN